MFGLGRWGVGLKASIRFSFSNRGFWKGIDDGGWKEDDDDDGR